MNPNNIFGDINGNEVASGGAITMFATFYAYSGTFGLPDNMSFVTVGDGYASEGLFIGNNHNTVQAAVNSLPTDGGIVFIKEGTYTFTNSVTLPIGVKLQGMNGAKIIRPAAVPAIILSDGYSGVDNLEIHIGPDITAGGAIELQNTNPTVREVEIVNNTIYSNVDGYSITLAPISNCTYRNLNIVNNIFRNEEALTVHIGQDPTGGAVATLDKVTIAHNTFGPEGISNTSIQWVGASVGNITDLHIIHNNISNGDISITIEQTIGPIYITGNTGNGLTLSSSAVNVTPFYISDNCINNLSITKPRSGKIHNNSITSDLLLTATSGSIVDVIVTNNLIDGDFIITGNNTQMFDITIMGNVLPVTGDISIQEINLARGIVISNNMAGRILGQNTIGTQMLLIDATISNNFFRNTIDSIVLNNNQTNSGTLDNVTISDNVMTGDLVINDSTTPASTTVVDEATISGNTMRNLTINGSVVDSNISNNISASSMTLGDLTDSIISGNRASSYSDNDATNTNYMGNVFDSVSNTSQSTSLHVADGYVTVDPGNNFAVGATIVGTGSDTGDKASIETLISGLTAPVGIALDVDAGKMYWADTTAIKRANLDGSGSENLVTGLTDATGIALDIAAGNMYWTDDTDNKIQRAKLDGSGVIDLIIGLLNPEAIILDIPEGKIYWTDTAAKLQRSNLDGTSVEDFVTTNINNPRGIALDISTRKVYWTDITIDTIQRIGTDGYNQETLLASLPNPRGIDLDIAAGKMYWLYV